VTRIPARFWLLIFWSCGLLYVYEFMCCRQYDWNSKFFWIIVEKQVFSNDNFRFGFIIQFWIKKHDEK
jgi:hypothetical protein